LAQYSFFKMFLCVIWVSYCGKKYLWFDHIEFFIGGLLFVWGLMAT
jgi:hypothetical protein